MASCVKTSPCSLFRPVIGVGLITITRSNCRIVLMGLGHVADLKRITRNSFRCG